MRSEGPLRESDVARVAIAVLKALQEAHGVGIIHRDLKPGNIILVNEPGEHHAVTRVLDFGIAKVMGEPAPAWVPAEPTDDDETGSHLVFCTPLYAAPELLRGKPDFATDLYGLGLVMAELLDGYPPYSGCDMSIQESPHLLDTPVPLGRRTGASALYPVIQRACAKRLDDRYASAVEMLAELEIAYHGLRRPEYQEQPLTVVPSPPVTNAPPAEDRARSQFIDVSRYVGTSVEDLPTEFYLPKTPGASASSGVPPLAYDADPVSCVVSDDPEAIAPIRRSPDRSTRPWLAAAALFVGIATVGLLWGATWDRGRLPSTGPDASAGQPPAAATTGLASEASAARAEAAASGLPAETESMGPAALAEALAEPIEFSEKSVGPGPAGVATHEARMHIDRALVIAPSALFSVRTNADAQVRIDGRDVGRLEQVGESATYALAAPLAAPLERPFTVELVGDRFVSSHVVSDAGPIYLDVDLAALREAASARDSSRSRRSSRRHRSRDDDRTSSPTTLLGPPIEPRTR